MVLEHIPERWDYYEICASHDVPGDLTDQLDHLKAELAPSVEYGASIVNSIVTGVPSVVYGNVPNAGALIANLPPMRASRCRASSTPAACSRRRRASSRRSSPP